MMTNENLYVAMAHVDPEYLEHSERKVRPQVKTARRALLAAALVAALTCTAFAIPAVRNMILGLEEQQVQLATVAETPSGEHAYQSVLDVTLNLDLRNGPETLEQAYVPLWLAENWEAVEQERYSSAPQTRRDSYLVWQSAAGETVSFRQSTAPGYPGEYAFDTIGVGYGGQYESGQVTYGGLDLWQIAAAPSQAENGDTHVGVRKFYWSDGAYIFTLETGYGVSTEILERIFGSITAVEDLADYENVTYVEYVEPEEPETQKTVWYPAWLPEGMEPCYGGIVDGCYEFYWAMETEADARVSLELLQRLDWDEGNIQNWETTSSQEVTKETVTIQGWEVTIYASEHKAEAMWQTGEKTNLR